MQAFLLSYANAYASCIVWRKLLGQKMGYFPFPLFIYELEI